MSAAVSVPARRVCLGNDGEMMGFWSKLTGRAAPASQAGPACDAIVAPAPRAVVRPRPPGPSVRSTQRAPQTGQLLSVLAGGADRVVVVDTETTGFRPSDRIVEVAAVTLDLDGNMMDEWATLIDPGRDVGPTHIHGVTAHMVAGAPTFSSVAGDLAERLNGAVFAAHNVPFDARMLGYEYQRCGVPFQIDIALDTLTATRAKLAVACTSHGVELLEAHAALNDARATAQLLVACATLLRGTVATPLVFPPMMPPSGRTHHRPGQASARSATPYLAQLAAKSHHQATTSAMASYLDVLDRVMADLHLNDDEHAELAQLAGDLGLDDHQLVQAHRRWLDDAIDQALSDGEVTDLEYDELCRAAAVLRLAQNHVDARTAPLRVGPARVTLEPGLKVCFTGVDDRGRYERHARQLGLEPVASVTIKNCQLLVAADPASRSDKADKARKYGHPLVSAATFLQAGVGATIEGVTTTVGLLDTLTCTACARAWTRPASRSRKPELCPTC